MAHPTSAGSHAPWCRPATSAGTGRARARAAPASQTTGSKRKRSRSATMRPTGWRGSCESTTVQPSSAACRNSDALTSTLVSGKSSKDGHPARIGAPRPHAQVAEEADRARAGRGPRWPGGRRCGRRCGRPTRPAGPPPRRPPRRPAPTARPAAARPARRRPAAAGWSPARTPTRAAARRSGRAERPVRRPRVSRPPAWSKCRWLSATASTVSGSKPAVRSAGRIGSPRTPRCVAVALVHALADPGLDQDAPRRRLDQQAVERLGQRRVRVQLVRDQALPQRCAARARTRSRHRR